MYTSTVSLRTDQLLKGKNTIYMASGSWRWKTNERLKFDGFLSREHNHLRNYLGSPSLCAVSDYARFHLDRRLTWGEPRVGSEGN